MAEGFELYHVPQQSRRDKLRVVVQNVEEVEEDDELQLQGCAGLLPLYDPSSSHLIPSSDLLSCANQNNPIPGAGVKEEGRMNFIRHGGGIMNASSSSSSTSSYMDPQSSLHMNPPGNIQNLNGSNHHHHPFYYNTNSLRVLDHQQPFNGGVGGGDGGELVVYKPEPLSLSLSSHNTHQSNLPLELNLQRYESEIYSSSAGGGGGEYFCRSTVPLGPFTGYASILKGSRFLKPAQHLLEEICDVGCGIYVEKLSADSALMDPPPPLESLSRGGFNVDDPNNGGDRRKKSRLISMLDEVYKRYKQYYQQIQAVVASFETVAGLSSAAPFANLDFKAMSKHFRYLKNAITDQLQFTTKPHVQINYSKEETPRSGSSDRSLYVQKPVNHESGFVDHQPVWRPQRGLPERAVTVLRAWLFDHFLHPYPTDTDKLMLAKQTGLSRNQVSNWFINARVRLWKPMVEEIHTLETRQLQKASQREEQDDNGRTDHLLHSNSLGPENTSISTHRMQDQPSKRTRNDFPNNPMGSVEQMNLPYDNFSRQRQFGTGASNIGGSRGVSLTLGLHQNNGITLSESFPMNAARRFGLDANSESFVMGGFEAQNRQFGREIIGGQLLHDFVG